jgi:colanic acid biosynthesis glycosyl transferase WcaI
VRVRLPATGPRQLENRRLLEDRTRTYHAVPNSMRITFVNRFFYPDISATSQLLTELAEDLKARGESVTVITGNTTYLTVDALPAYELHCGIRIERVGFTHFGRSRSLGRILDYFSFWAAAFWKVLRLKQQDCLVVMSDPPILSLFAAIVRIFNSVTTVCWLQDMYPDIAIHAGMIRDSVAAKWLRRIAVWSLRQMDHIVVIGRCMERRLVSLGLTGNTIANIPNWADGVRIRSIPREENAFARRNGLQDRFVVMYSGNHGIVHEFDSVLDLVRATRTVPRLCFCFIGEGAWKQRMIEMSRAEAWPHVVFLPYQTKSTLEFSLSAADVHLVSLKDSMEGLCVPSKLYGAMAAGRPVLFVGPAKSEAALIIREAGCGVHVAPGDTACAVQALLQFYGDHSLTEQQGRAAREYFERYCDRSLSTERFRQVLHRIREQPAQALQVNLSSPPTRRH